MSQHDRKVAREAVLSFALMLTSSVSWLGGGAAAFWVHLALAQGVVATVLGIAALVRIRCRPTDLWGFGFAVGGILGSIQSITLGVPALPALVLVLLITWYVSAAESQGLFSHPPAPGFRALLLASTLAGVNYASVAASTAMLVAAMGSRSPWIHFIPDWVVLTPLGALCVSLGLSAVARLWPRQRRHSETTVLVNLGVATSILGILVMVVFLYPVLLRELEAGRRGICLSNEKDLLRTVLETGMDGPSAWCDDVGAAGKASALVCPSAPHSSCAYALNPGALVRGTPEPGQARFLVLIFETDAGWNAVGGPELLPDEPRHFRGDSYGFADGHVAWIPRKQLGTDEDGNRIWTKEPDAEVIWEPVLNEGEERSLPDP